MKAWNSPSGVATGSISTSVVVLEPVPITILRSSKLMPTPTQNRSSVSRYTHTSDSTAVPTRCRHTASGRRVIVQFHPEHPLAVRREACAANAGELFGQFADRLPGLPARQGRECGNHIARSPATSTPYSIQRSVLAQIQAAEPEEVMPLGFLVRIKNDLFTGHGAGRALRIARPAGPSHRHRARGCGIARHTVCPAACG